MSYIRPLQYNAGLYIYPEEDGVRFMSFPNHMGEKFPDEMLDILLSKMSDEEIVKRKKHGCLLLKALSDGDYDKYKENRNFQEV